MPFRSKSQLRKFAVLVKQGKLSHAEFQKWADATKSIKSLPDKVKKPKK